jgi:hypothetical protein
LDPGQKDMARILGIFLIETDRTLVDSHCSPLKPLPRPALLS